MKIIVCIKQIPETSEVGIHPDTHTLIRDGVKSIINPFDLHALEESIRLKEKHDGKVIVISMGPPQAANALREALAFGADEAYLLTDNDYAGSDTYATATVISCAIRKLGDADIILTGRQAIDGDTSQVGPEVAEKLEIPHSTNVSEISEVWEGKHIVVKRLLEEGYATVRMTLPILITVVKEINIPRIPNLKDIINAKKKPVTTWNNAVLNIDKHRIGLGGSPTKVKEVFAPAKNVHNTIFNSDIKSSVAALLKELKQRGIIINSMVDRQNNG